MQHSRHPAAGGRLAALITLSFWLVPTAAVPPTQAADSPDATGPVVMLGEYQGLAWWIVDPDSHVTAFYGGDIQAICRDDPMMFSAVKDFSYVKYVYLKAPTEKRRFNDLERGSDVAASLWDGPPPFVLPQLCADILARSPIATGTAHVHLSAVNVGNAPVPDARGRSVLTFSGQGTMNKPDGTTIRVQSSSGCSWPTGESKDTVYDCRGKVQVH